MINNCNLLPERPPSSFVELPFDLNASFAKTHLHADSSGSSSSSSTLKEPLKDYDRFLEDVLRHTYRYDSDYFLEDGIFKKVAKDGKMTYYVRCNHRGESDCKEFLKQSGIDESLFMRCSRWSQCVFYAKLSKEQAAALKANKNIARVLAFDEVGDEDE